jgi:hypothetical protein
VARAEDQDVDTPTEASTDAGGNAYDAFIEEALKAYDQGRFAEARTQFRRAHELAPSARTLRTIGMCSFNLGDYLDALQNLDAALNERREPLSRDKRAHVADLIARSQVHVGRFRVHLTPADAVLWVDGGPPPRLSSGELLLDPGRHELLAQAAGHQPARSTLQVEGGDRTTLEIRLEPITGPEVAAAGNPGLAPSYAPQPAPPAPTEPHSSTQATLAYVALGVGAAGLVAFGVTTGLAASKAGTLDERCRDRACGPDFHDDVDSYNRYKLLSTVSLIGGLVFAGAGVTLLLTQPEGSSERAGLTPWIGLGAAGVRGRL